MWHFQESDLAHAAREGEKEKKKKKKKKRKVRILREGGFVGVRARVKGDIAQRVHMLQVRGMLVTDQSRFSCSAAATAADSCLLAQPAILKHLKMQLIACLPVLALVLVVRSCYRHTEPVGCLGGLRMVARIRCYFLGALEDGREDQMLLQSQVTCRVHCTASVVLCCGARSVSITTSHQQWV